MKYAVVGLTGLCSIAAMLVVSQAEARGIRTDTNTSNGWNSCNAGNPCATLPTGLEFNAFGSNPAGSGPAATLTGGPGVFPGNPQDGLDAQTPCAPLSSNCSDSSGDWSAKVPGVAYAASTSTVQSQVVFFDLSNNPTQSVYGPVPALDGGNPIPLGSAAAGVSAWEIEFNYDPNHVSSSASLEFGGNIYTATQSVLSPNNLNEFVEYNGILHAPTGWVESPASVSAPEIDPAAAFAGFTLLAGMLAVLRGGRRTPARTA